MRYPPHLLDEIRARLPVSQVVARKVALKRKGREFSGLSPFKTEKTPSFFVNDHKGFYHCFASGEHGDIFTFLMKTEGLSFPEAVERLAEEAGVSLPKPNAADAQAADHRDRLAEVVAASRDFFIGELYSPRGREAHAYLTRRGLTRETIDRFGLGYAPASRTALKSHLASRGFTEADMALSGMLISGEDIREPYDRFRHRVMFPITDLKGRPIAFGGRALEKDQPAKYLNSPETPLFHKGGLLFNAAGARKAAHDRSRVLVVEGYMDVISLVQAGFEEAVAPLGTALTEEQLALVWRMASEPVLCFDGDGAGRRAAFRAIDVALPHLKPGASLSFAFLPDGLDPDDLIRSGGREGMEAILTRARPLADVLFEREWGSGGWNTPERRAGLEQTLRGLVARIADTSLRGYYERDIKDRLFAAWRSQKPEPATQPPPRQGARTSPGVYVAAAGGRSGGFNADQRRGDWRKPAQPQPPRATSALRRSTLVASPADPGSQREALILRTLLNHAWLIEDHAETIADIEIAAEPLAILRDALLSAHAAQFPLDSATLRSHLTAMGLDKVVALVERSAAHRCDRFADPEADEVEVERGFRHALTLHESQVGLQRSLQAAELAWHAEGSEAALTRIREIKQRLADLGASHGDAETGRGEVLT
ncbi:MAG: DNA primase [Hyphomicrobiaceae bacterium]|nr:DNA primase [Hyphomicrobiaceae bacterium]